MRLRDARDTQCFSSPPARPIGRPSKPRRSSSSCRTPPTAPMRRPRRTRGSRRAASWRPAPPSSSRNPGAANGARRRSGHNHVVSARSVSSAAPPSRRAHGPRARAQDAAGRRRSRGLDDHAFDVEETFEYAVHQAFSVVRFFGRKTEYAETPPTLTKPTAQRRTHTHENSNSATKQASASSS